MATTNTFLELAHHSFLNQNFEIHLKIFQVALIGYRTKTLYLSQFFVVLADLIDFLYLENNRIIF